MVQSALLSSFSIRLCVILLFTITKKISMLLQCSQGLKLVLKISVPVLQFQPSFPEKSVPVLSTWEVSVPFPQFQFIAKNHPVIPVLNSSSSSNSKPWVQRNCFRKNWWFKRLSKASNPSCNSTLLILKFGSLWPQTPTKALKHHTMLSLTEF